MLSRTSFRPGTLITFLDPFCAAKNSHTTQRKSMCIGVWGGVGCECGDVGVGVGVGGKSKKEDC